MPTKQAAKMPDKEKDTTENLRMRLEDGRKMVTERADRTMKRSRKTIQDHPITAVGAGVAAGAVVGVVAATLLTRRKKAKSH